MPFFEGNCGKWGSRKTPHCSKGSQCGWCDIKVLALVSSSLPDRISNLPSSIVSKGCGSPVIKVSDHGRHIMSSSPVKTRRVGQRCTLNLSRAETSSRCGEVVRIGVPAQVSSTLLDQNHGPRVAGQCDVNIHLLHRQ
ncbi:uncharacterized protein TNCV_435481 [Trichonephila clavipes]|nr:uncharacterized protein TNCV_435481 [Trichonephila clavipes]